MPKRYRYTGKERDEESGLYYHGPVLCTVAGEVDEDRSEESLADDINVYIHVRDNPLRFLDLNGEDSEEWRGIQFWRTGVTHLVPDPGLGITIPFDISGRKIGPPSLNVDVRSLLPSQTMRDPLEELLPLRLSESNMGYRMSLGVLSVETPAPSASKEGSRAFGAEAEEHFALVSVSLF